MAESYTSTVCSPECRFIYYSNESAPNDCWNWSGPMTNGYGRLFLNMSRNGKRLSIAEHRYALNRIGIETPDGKLVMHSCDNPACVNPAHLSVGTWLDNNRDREAKGRTVLPIWSEERKARQAERCRGSKNSSAKLNEAQAKAIKEDKRGCQTIANEYGVSKKLVLNIRHGRAWKHI